MITLVGQSNTFGIEVIYGILQQYLIHKGKIGGFFEPGAIPCVLLTFMALITVVQIATYITNGVGALIQPLTRRAEKLDFINPQKSALRGTPLTRKKFRFGVH